MDRREFLYGAATAALSGSHKVCGASSLPVPSPRPGPDAPVMPLDFMGLSYEMGQLYNPDFFSPRNRPLIEAFRSLSHKGVLRLGGHLSNITKWEGVGQSDPKQVRGVRHGIEDYWEWPLVDPAVQQNKGGVITRNAIRNLCDFLAAVDWRLIYGLNFACGSPARAADEAEAVAASAGGRLLAFVLGNEPEGYADDPYFRGKGYNFDQYFAEYQSWVKSIRERVPHAPCAGPDTDGKVDTWVLEYARRTRGDAVLLTSHYYGMGPASDPAMTAERLLRKDHPELDAEIAGVRAARAAAGGTPYRMDEGNSCFGGGRKGVSDAYASALWAADYMLTAACAGFMGVNLHGGGVGIYTPIESSAKAPASPRPLYYGMQFAQQFAGFGVSRWPLDTAANITAYRGSKAGQSMVAFVNKGATAVRVRLPDAFGSAATMRAWELHGPALDARSGVRFGPTSAREGTEQIEVPGYSGVIFQVG